MGAAKPVEPGLRVATYISQDVQMMDMYYGQKDNGLYLTRDPVIAEFVHYAMGYKDPFQGAVSGWDALVAETGKAHPGFEGWRGVRGKAIERLKGRSMGQAIRRQPGEVTRFFGSPMSPEQARDRLHLECERSRSRGLQYWPIFLSEKCRVRRLCRLAAMVDRPPGACVWVKKHCSPCYDFDTLDLPLIMAGHGTAHNDSRKLLERVGSKYTMNILWGPKRLKSASGR